MSNPFDDRRASQVTAKQSILSALSAVGSSLTTQQLTACGALFGVDAAAVRVALGRLVKAGDVVTVERGVHELGDKGRPILDAILRWRDVPELTRGWDGAWLVVHTAHLGRTNRPRLRRRERALAVLGFAEHTGGMWLRPDNLEEDADGVLGRLVALGLEPEAMVLAGARVVTASDHLATLWDRERLEAGYVAARDAMAACTARSDTLTHAELARQTALIGHAVVGMLSFDPLLPEALVDTALRGDVHADMVAFDELGKDALDAYWEETL